MAASIPLEVHAGSGWLVGFGNMVHKEWGSWWRTRRSLTHLILWLFVINGLMLLVGVDERRGNPPLEVLEELIEVFIRAGGLFATIGIVVATQSAVFGEKQLGTAEWVLSKPISRPAFSARRASATESFSGMGVTLLHPVHWRTIRTRSLLVQ